MSSEPGGCKMRPKSNPPLPLAQPAPPFQLHTPSTELLPAEPTTTKPSRYSGYRAAGRRGGCTRCLSGRNSCGGEGGYKRSHVRLLVGDGAAGRLAMEVEDDRCDASSTWTLPAKRALNLRSNKCRWWGRLKCLCQWTVRPNSRTLHLLLLLCMMAGVLQVSDGGNASGSETFYAKSPLAQALNDNPELVRNWEPIQDYLTKYGYLPRSNNAADNLRTEEQLRESIKTMQRFGSIAPTGRVDGPTLELLRRPRCGMPDLIGSSERVKRYAIQGQQWPKTDLTWSIKDWAPNIDPMRVKDQLGKAFKVWSDVSKLNFQEIRSSKADIVISFLRGTHGDGYPFDGRGVVLAHAFFPGEGIGGDAHFDAEELWVTQGEPDPGTDGVSLFAVAAHEFGHSLGLSHSSVPGSLMNPFYQSIKDNFQLPRDDTVGIQMLYGARNPNRWVPLPPYTTTTTTKNPRKYPPVTKKTPSTHKPRGNQPSTASPVIPTRSKPYTCNTTFDAISVIRRELFIFRGKYFWRLNDQGLMKDYPVEIKRFWPHLTSTVDAVYERPIDTKIVFFSGQQYWLFNGNEKERDYPRPLTDLGLPPELKKVDAAMVWGYNGKTYLFSGDRYWRYDETEGRVELDYPRDMAMWRGVPYNIDAAFQHTNGHTYFFKGKHFWQFNDQLMHVQANMPGNINQYWFGCPSRNERPTVEDDKRNAKSHTDPISKAYLPKAGPLLSLVVATLICIQQLLHL